MSASLAFMGPIGFQEVIVILLILGIPALIAAVIVFVILLAIKKNKTDDERDS